MIENQTQLPADVQHNVETFVADVQKQVDAVFALLPVPTPAPIPVGVPAPNGGPTSTGA